MDGKRIRKATGKINDMFSSIKTLKNLNEINQLVIAFINVVANKVRSQRNTDYVQNQVKRKNQKLEHDNTNKTRKRH